MAVLDKVRPGKWKAGVCVDTIDSWGERVYILDAVHASVKDTRSLMYENIFELGVDSGSMSIIDAPYYRIKNGSGDEFEKDDALREAFNDKMWELRRFTNFGIYTVEGQNVGIVSSSGIGDGGYPLLVAKEGDEIIGLRIEFL